MTNEERRDWITKFRGEIVEKELAIRHLQDECPHDQTHIERVLYFHSGYRQQVICDTCSKWIKVQE